MFWINGSAPEVNCSCSYGHGFMSTGLLAGSSQNDHEQKPIYHGAGKGLAMGSLQPQLSTVLLE